MTQAEAQAEAVRRWGVHAFIHKSKYGWHGSSANPDPKSRCVVMCGGREVDGDRCETPGHYGQGRTWESAFADADTRQRDTGGK